MLVSVWPGLANMPRIISGHRERLALSFDASAQWI